MDSPTGNLFDQLRSIPAVFALLTIILTHPAVPQITKVNSLGVKQSFDFPAVVTHPVLFRFSSSKSSDLLWYDRDSSVFTVSSNSGKGKFTGTKVLARSVSVTSFIAGNVNDDGLDDIVVVHRELNQIELLLSRKNDSTYLSSSYTVNFYPEQAAIGDLNNDKIPDVMTYGKLSSGVSFLQGRGNGKLFPAKTLFENLPVNELSLVALNGDNIIDVALHNWLTNETVLFLGLGKLKFSEQTVLSFAEDTVRVQFLDVNNDRLTDVAVSSAKDRTLQILEGDGLGNFSFSQAIPLYHVPTAVTKGNFRTTSSADLLISDPAQQLFSLLLNKTDGNFFEEIIYGIGSPNSEILCGDLNGDKLSDIMLVSSAGTSYDILWNTATLITIEGQEVSFPVGLHPSNLTVTDLNGDGKDDLVVCNENSSSLSLLISSSPAYFSGQVTLETPEKPFNVSLYAKNDSTLTLYTAHQDDPKISLITLRKEADTLATLTGDVEQFSIPLPDKPTTILPDVSYMEKGISLYAFMASSTNSIVFYQQVKGTRFLTRSLVSLIPSKIIYSTINDLNNDGKTDLVYVYSDEKIRSTMFGLTMNDSIGTFKGKPYSKQLSDSVNRRAFVLTDDFNGDQMKDVLVYTSPENTLRLALGNKETSFGQFDTIAKELTVKASEQLQQYDFDNDGNLDILYHDRITNELNLYRGKGNGKFFSPVQIADIPKESVFRCGDFNGDSAADIAYTKPLDASITVIYGH